MTSSEIAVLRSGRTPFRAHARLIRLLGEELISDEVIAVVELVKNAYDADAHRVTVTLENITDLTNGVISIRDDGIGMDLQTVLHNWMEPASSQKRAKKGMKPRTPRGRVQLGEKGVGRFAADKLGSELELISRPAEAEEEVVLKVGWHHYDHDKYLDEVENTWHTREPVEFKGKTHGTRLLIRNLRTAWNEEIVTRLHTGLVRLVSPSAASSEFVIEIECKEFTAISGRVMNPLLETAPYRIAGTVDEKGILTLPGSPSRFIDLLPLGHNHFRTLGGDLRLPCCGPFSVSLNIWDLEPIISQGLGVDRALRETIKASSGVSIYRDGFRIWPYGEKDDDWLELNQRRVNNPTLRVSNNQVIGFVEISHAGNPELRDRTSREGLLDTPAFFDLKALVLAALSVLEVERFERRRFVTPLRTGAKPEGEEDEILQSLSRARVAAGGGQGAGVRSALQEMERLYRQRLDQERTRYNQVSRLAGVGMAAELLTDAFSREISNAMTLLRTLQGETQAGAGSVIQSLVEGLSRRMEVINEQLDLMGPLYRSSLEETEPVYIYGAAYDVVSILAGRLVETGTQVNLAGQRGLAVRLNRGHIMQVLMILLENALRIMEDAGTLEPCIDIEVVAENGFSGLLVADSGPGVPENIHKLIFEPYFSTRRAGRGLGLHVASDILAGYNSTLNLVSGKSRLPGACFEVRFDGRRVATGPAQSIPDR
jgi:hypothetical protein